MEFIKHGKNYIIKNSNGRIVTEKEKLELENKELILKDITGCECQQETTKKISKNKKRIKELENNKLDGYKITTEDLDINATGIVIPNGKVVLKKIEENALNHEGESANDIIKETTESI